MNDDLKNRYLIFSKQSDVNQFLNENEKALEIFYCMDNQLSKHFPNSRFSLELCDKLTWTTEIKLLLNVHMTKEMFFRDVLNHFNDIYDEISPLIEDCLCPVVLFPLIFDECFDRFGKYSAINLIAKTAYFNNDFDENFQREMTIREIPKDQQVKEIIEYCNNHDNTNISDMVFDLQLDLFDVDRIIDELEEKEINLNVDY